MDEIESSTCVFCRETLFAGMYHLCTGGGGLTYVEESNPKLDESRETEDPNEPSCW